MLLLSASKYRVEITPSRYRLTFIVLFECILLAFVWLWEPNWFPYQLAVQVLLSLLLLMHAAQACKTSLKGILVISLYQDGRWLYLLDDSIATSSMDKSFIHNVGLFNKIDTTQTAQVKPQGSHDIGDNVGIQWRISSGSRYTGWLAWLQLSGNGKQHWFWVFRDEVSDADYRRICLAIRYSHQLGIAKNA